MNASKKSYIITIGITLGNHAFCNHISSELSNFSIRKFHNILPCIQQRIVVCFSSYLTIIIPSSFNHFGCFELTSVIDIHCSTNIIIINLLVCHRLPQYYHLLYREKVCGSHPLQDNACIHLLPHQYKDQRSVLLHWDPKFQAHPLS